MNTPENRTRNKKQTV